MTTSYENLTEFAKAVKGSNYLIVPSVLDSKVSFHPVFLEDKVFKVHIKEPEVILYLYKRTEDLYLDFIINVATLRMYELDDNKIISYIDTALIDCIESCLYALYYLKDSSDYKDEPVLEESKDTLLNTVIHLTEIHPFYKYLIGHYVSKIDNMTPSIQPTRIYELLKENSLI